MSKSWQYSRWRRVAMQVTLVVILAATVGVAALISHQRAQHLNLKLGPPVTAGALRARLPDGWAVQRSRQLFSRAVRAQAPPPHAGRSLVIWQEPVPATMTAEKYLERQAALRVGGFEARPAYEQFDFLGVGGFVIDLQGENAQTGEISSRLYAAAVLPPTRTGGMALGVCVGIEGPGVFGPSIHRLLRNVASGLTDARTSAAIPPTPERGNPTNRPVLRSSPAKG